MHAQGKATRWVAAITLGIAAVLAGCGGAGSSGSGVIAFDESAPMAVTKGSHREVTLMLLGGSAIVGRSVTVASSDASVADVTPATCTLSTSSDASARCKLKVLGKSSGTVDLTAQADGYADVPLRAAVVESPVYGTLAAGDGTTGLSGGPVSVSFNGVGTAPYQKKLKAAITGSSGITDATGAVINFSSSSPHVSFNPSQCEVSTASPECDTVATLPAAVATVISVQVVGAVLAGQPGYRAVTINATPDLKPSQGTITLSTQAGNNVPNGMKAPLFVNWVDAQIADTVTVTLGIAPAAAGPGGGISFYDYAAGDNRQMQTSQTRTCTLRYTGEAATSVTSCGLGIAGAAPSGAYVISATASAASKHAYVVQPLTVGAVAPEPARRSITFTNNASGTVYVGITGGASGAYVDASTPAVRPGATAANLKPGAGSLCGASNPRAACPIGTSCIQGGAAPSAKTADTPFYCYYDQPTPSKGYELASGASTTLEISGSSLTPGGIIWSGNLYGRTGCDPLTGVCENASCRGAAGGLACGAGTGPSPGTNTLAELTFQAFPAVDFYDVSIINGANLAIQFGPDQRSASPSNGYSCGIAGSLTGSYTPGSNDLAKLPAAGWRMSPTSASFPGGATPPGEAASYYRVVIPSSATPQPCSSSDTCTSGTDTACGYPMSELGKGKNATFVVRQCGRPVAWLSADSIWGFNQSASNAAPFGFTTQWTVGSQTVSVGDLQLCINNTYSAYDGNGTASSTPPFPVQPVALSCGGVMWGGSESPGPLQNPVANIGQQLTVPARPVQTANALWLDHVLPTIAWLKAACPTCYTYPFDDMTSTFTCAETPTQPNTAYGVRFSDLR